MLNLESADMILSMSLWIKSFRVTIQMKVIEQYFPVVLFSMLYESEDEILKCGHSNESY